MVLFIATGLGNGSTFRSIPYIFPKELAGPVLGWTSAIAAYGAFFIPKSYGTSIAMTGGPQAALWGFLIFYVTCVIATWFYYTRRGGVLFDVERKTASSMASASAR